MEARHKNGFGVVQNGLEERPGDPPATETGPAAEGDTRRPVAQWSVVDVCAWLGRGPLGPPDSPLLEAAHRHAISGKALLRLTEETLERMGIAPKTLCQALLREICHLRLQQEMEELLDIMDNE
ncbi:sterile alpha motif domain-containing protein 12-like [Sceloporus undulatus]|uniref:sterile alpha motif domain-containing protein 12-like n=1 Tax=Sceloporus undulatus TaxID=8520 RepID=UPI001C4D1E58|nr:sterile alpha motif domain-containing protein 12-like [Sceloporus undulatus]